MSERSASHPLHATLDDAGHPTAEETDPLPAPWPDAELAVRDEQTSLVPSDDWMDELTLYKKLPTLPWNDED